MVDGSYESWHACANFEPKILGWANSRAGQYWKNQAWTISEAQISPPWQPIPPWNVVIAPKYDWPGQVDTCSFHLTPIEWGCHSVRWRGSPKRARNPHFQQVFTTKLCLIAKIPKIYAIYQSWHVSHIHSSELCYINKGCHTMRCHNNGFSPIISVQTSQIPV